MNHNIFLEAGTAEGTNLWIRIQRKGQNLKRDRPVTVLPFLFILNCTMYGLEMTQSSSSLRKSPIWQLQSLRVSFSVQYWDGCDWHFHHVNQMGFAVAAPGSTFDQKWKSESLSVADSLACRTSQQLSAKVFIRPHRTLLLELDTTFPVSIFWKIPFKDKAWW